MEVNITELLRRQKRTFSKPNFLASAGLAASGRGFAFVVSDALGCGVAKGIHFAIAMLRGPVDRAWGG
jgi:hypothetical protein